MPGKQKPASIDAAFKAIIREMDIPQQKDIDRLNAKLDRLEKQLKRISAPPEKIRSPRASVKTTGSKQSDTDVVLTFIKRSKNPVDIEGLKKKTGFEDKKMRNIVFRLHKLGKINRVGRGKYEGM